MQYAQWMFIHVDFSLEKLKRVHRTNTYIGTNKYSPCVIISTRMQNNIDSI